MKNISSTPPFNPLRALLAAVGLGVVAAAAAAITASSMPGIPEHKRILCLESQPAPLPDTIDNLNPAI